MGRLHRVKRNEKEITVTVLTKGEIINGEYVPAGWIKVVAGVNDEVYRIDPETFALGYAPSDELKEEIKKANGWERWPH